MLSLMVVKSGRSFGLSAQHFFINSDISLEQKPSSIDGRRPYLTFSNKSMKKIELNIN